MVSPSQMYNNVQDKISNPLAQTTNEPKKMIGVIAVNHEPKHGNIAYVYPLEALPLSVGVLVNRTVPIKQSFTDASGRSVVATGNHANTIPCIYFSRDSMRKTPPNVQRGEKVHIWYRGNTNEWFWEPMNSDSTSNRRQETVVNSINADPPTGPDSGKHDSSNSYYTEMSSHNKTMTFGTSKANGEIAAYKIQMNGQTGAIVLQDDIGNVIELDTAGTTIRLKNNCGTEYRLENNNIFIHCNENMNIDVGGNFQAKIGGNLDIEVGGSTTLKTNGLKVDSPDSEFTGNVAIKGGLDVTGASAMGGGGTVQGQLTVEGTHTVTGPVVLAGGTSSGVIHGSYIDT